MRGKKIREEKYYERGEIVESLAKEVRRNNLLLKLGRKFLGVS